MAVVPPPIVTYFSDIITATPRKQARKITRGDKAMTIRLGDTAPDFTQDSTDGTINFYQYAGDNWVILFSHPEVLPLSAQQNWVTWRD